MKPGCVQCRNQNGFIFIVLVDASFGKLYIYCKNFENWGYVIEALSFLTLILKLESCCEVGVFGDET